MSSKLCLKLPAKCRLPVLSTCLGFRQEAAEDAAQEPLLSSFLYATILSHTSFKHALATVLANRLSNPTILATELYDIFLEVLESHTEIQQAALADVIAVRERVRS